MTNSSHRHSLVFLWGASYVGDLMSTVAKLSPPVTIVPNRSEAFFCLLLCWIRLKLVPRLVSCQKVSKIFNSVF